MNVLCILETDRRYKTKEMVILGNKLRAITRTSPKRLGVMINVETKDQIIPILFDRIESGDIPQIDSKHDLAYYKLKKVLPENGSLDFNVDKESLICQTCEETKQKCFC